MLRSYEGQDLEDEYQIWKVKSYDHETGVLVFWDKQAKGLRHVKVHGPGSAKIIIH